ncbi:MAG: imidazolonepropionase [Dehalococcoidia bacterium]|nr:imidazolonepropionase [Dehalococcoidia bacterium]MDH4367488.1 imidazolonepropionase [Dehalococcoidia bacterium]
MIADVLIKNASELVTARGPRGSPKTKEAMEDLGIITNGAVAIDGKEIVAVGETDEVLAAVTRARTVIDATDRIVLPGFVDCHTHLVFGGSREDEFIQKIGGRSYLEIMQGNGGILSTVEKTREALASPRALLNRAGAFLDKMLAYGTTTTEIKTGYGLSTESELALLKIIASVKESQPVDIVATFLGAHAFPKEYAKRKADYIQLVLGMLERVKTEGLAEYCDVFVEVGAFSPSEARTILEQAKKHGLKLKLHAGEFNDIGGAELGAELGATSIDHLDYISERGIELMAEKKIIAVLLPGVPFHLMTDRYAPARKLIDAGVPVALATDFNPGSCPTLSMQMIIALACRQLKMTPAEAINAATINAAYALDRGDKVGSIEVGKRADTMVLDIPHHRQLPYWFGVNLVTTVVKNGVVTYPP